MQYDQMEQGIFKGRPNRFLADVELIGASGGAGRKVRCHVKNTGRLKELLIPGRTVWIEHCDKPERKTKYSLIAVEKPADKGERVLVNIDSQAPNEAAFQWVKQGAGGIFKEIQLVQKEKKFGNSRFDLYIEANGRKCFMEVKGVTLDVDGVARFPDAPTERGVKHVEELAACLDAGYEAYILFVIQMKGIHAFEPNDVTHPQFGRTLREASAAGVTVLACDCIVTETSMTIDRPVTVRL